MSRSPALISMNSISFSEVCSHSFVPCVRADRLMEAQGHPLVYFSSFCFFYTVTQLRRDFTNSPHLSLLRRSGAPCCRVSSCFYSLSSSSLAVKGSCSRVLAPADGTFCCGWMLSVNPVSWLAPRRLGRCPLQGRLAANVKSRARWCSLLSWASTREFVPASHSWSAASPAAAAGGPGA